MRLPQPPPTDGRRIEADEVARILDLLPHVRDERYLHWDDLRRKALPDGVQSAEDWWLALKIGRAVQYRRLPFTDVRGRPMRYALPDAVLQLLHQVDRRASGRIALPEQVTDPRTRDRYIVSSLMEEAITSSQLEGAATTRKVAKEMLRSRREPRSHGERMIRNNYAAILRIRDMAEEPLTPDRVLELHRILSDGTLRNPLAEGRLRTTDDVAVRDDQDQVLHQPPAASELGDRLERLCAFANVPSEPFVHPVTRALLLHFVLAYDHPFEDGNGRTARALFYWSMLHEGYWLAEFLSISRLLKRAPSQYARAFLLTESDDNDVTYFLLHQLRTVDRAIDELDHYLARKVEERRQTEQLLRDADGLNHRQIALLSHAQKHPDTEYTFESHRASHGVVYQTARADLLELEDLGLLVKRKRGRQYYFLPAEGLTGRLAGLSNY